MIRRIAPLTLFLFAACKKDEPTPEQPLQKLREGAPIAGVAERPLDLPIGAPMGGYSARCRYLGEASQVDSRDSNYVTAWAASVGMQSWPMAKVLWLHNGDQHLVLVKADLIYSFDGLVEALEDRLIAATGLDLDGRVIITTSHSHASWSNFSDQYQFYLGGDRYNEEIFQRLATSLSDAALAAWQAREPAAIGLGLTKDWDPSNLVYSDRRGDNDDLAFFDDIPAGSYKDPNLWVMRVDSADGEPMGVFYGFGMHGTVLDDDSPMLSTDSTGAVEVALQESFDRPVVVAHIQGGAGDASPRGSDDGYARLETLGEYATEAIYGLWQATPTSADPIQLETLTRAIPQGRDEIAVTRAGTTDLRYAPYDDAIEPDDVVFGEDGQILSPIDEFNVPYGAAFCGSGVDGLGGFGTGATVPPYDTCVDVEPLSAVLENFFKIDEGELTLPLPESLVANTSATLLGPLTILEPDGSTTVDAVMFGFLPGEPTAMYTEQFRRRVAAELGFTHAIPVGYAQDHEGYLLIPEDWLSGGYEPNINILGPLQGEHILEGLLEQTAPPLLTDDREHQHPDGRWESTTYLDRPLPELAPDLSPEAGTVADEVPENLWLPVDLEPAVQPEARIARVQGAAQLIWQGGDPGVDLPIVTLERLGEDGSWDPVQTHAGRDLRVGYHDILLSYVPSPLEEAEDQTHWWWASWQAVGHVRDRAGVPEGTYRLHVQGERYLGGDTTWPWTTEPYVLVSEPFEVVPATLTVSWDGATARATLEAPDWGWRLVDIEGSSTGDNPPRGATLSWELADGAEVLDEAEPTISGGAASFAVSPPEGAVGLVITDSYGNTGRLDL